MKAIITGIICFFIGTTSTVFAVKTNLIQVPDSFNGVSTIEVLNWASLQYKKGLGQDIISATPKSIKDYNDCINKIPPVKVNGKTVANYKDLLEMKVNCEKAYAKANKKN